MNNDWVYDIASMHEHYGFHQAIEGLNKDQLKQLLEFRLNFITEENNELNLAYKNGDAEEIVDALIDIIVVSIGTLDLFVVDSVKAWNAVHFANMSKKVGIKESRPNPLGLPDLVKPEGWQAPSHKDNHGKLHGLFVDQGH